jgi:hypothetical protein
MLFGRRFGFGENGEANPADPSLVPTLGIITPGISALLIVILCGDDAGARQSHCTRRQNQP